MITQSLLGKTQQGEEVYLFRLQQTSGQFIEVSNYGASWISCVVLDKNGIIGDVLPGYPTLEGYLSYKAYPSILFYSGGYLESSRTGKSGMKYTPSDGLCLETQYFPDAPNYNHFLSPIVTPGKPYSHRTTCRFKSLT